MENNQKFFNCLCCGIKQVKTPMILSDLCDKCYPIWSRQKYKIDLMTFVWLGHGLSVNEWVKSNGNTCKCEDNHEQ